MAETNNKATLQNMQSKLQAMGGVKAVSIGEPPSVQSGHVSIIMNGGEVDETTLGQPREIHRVTLRRWEQWQERPVEQIEFDLDEWRTEIMKDFFGDFDLGGTVAYALPAEFSWAYGYQTIGQTVHRMLDLEIAYRVDGRSTFVA